MEQPCGRSPFHAPETLLGDRGHELGLTDYPTTVLRVVVVSSSRNHSCPCCLRQMPRHIPPRTPRQRTQFLLQSLGRKPPHTQSQGEGITP